MLVKRIIALVLTLVLAACAHIPPPVTANCILPAYRLVVSKDGIGPTGATRQSTDAAAFGALISSEVRRARTLRGARSAIPDVLILSGGSQHGAFGAGFFAGLGRKGGVPDYPFVTGVSTGALVSTLVFLANSPVDPDRHYPSYMTGTKISNLEDNASIFSVDKEAEILHVRKGSALAGITEGSLATFDPLRSLIFRMLTDKTLYEIQKQHQAGRHLLVGVTNLHDGDGYAIDLAEYVDTAIGRGVPTDGMRMCYIDALLASSSVPPGMPPISLVLQRKDSNDPPHPGLYVDGGARFGVFFGQLQNFPNLPDDLNAIVLINGTFSAGEWDDFNKNGKWSILNVAKRSSEILINQVYQFSLDQIEHEFQRPRSLRIALISNLGIQNSHEEAGVDPDSFPYQEGFVRRTCGDWRRYDDEKYHPLEFHPDYMQCLVSYGRARGMSSAARWNRVWP